MTQISCESPSCLILFLMVKRRKDYTAHTHVQHIIWFSLIQSTQDKLTPTIHIKTPFRLNKQCRIISMNYTVWKYNQNRKVSEARITSKDKKKSTRNTIEKIFIFSCSYCLSRKAWGSLFCLMECWGAGEETEQKLIIFFLRKRNSRHTHIHAHACTYHYQCYCEMIFLLELLLKEL